MIRNIWILIAKKLSGEATAEELRELDAMLDQAEADVLMNDLQSVWKKNDNNLPDDAAIEKKWELFNDKLDLQPAAPATTARPHRSIWFRLLAYAAVLAVLISGTWLLVKTEQADHGTTSIAAPVAGVSKILLPDGSSVWLNSGSRISYRNNPKTNCREVDLTGEAYFDVVKDAKHPFTVSTHTFKIRVLGTAFNVRSYAADAVSETTLLRGRIELTLNNNPEKKFILKPSEKIRIKNPELVAKRQINIQNGGGNRLMVELSTVKERKTDGLSADALWTKDVIDFDSTDFTEIAEMMQHKYNISFVFKNEETRKLKFTGKFKNETVAEAMKELQATANFKYRIEDDQITVY